MRKIYLSLGLLVAVSMVLSACAVPTAPPAENHCGHVDSGP